MERLLQDVRDYMLKVLTRFVQEKLTDYPRLLSNVQGDLQQLVNERHETAAKLLDVVLESESSCILTMDEVTYSKLRSSPGWGLLRTDSCVCVCVCVCVCPALSLYTST